MAVRKVVASLTIFGAHPLNPFAIETLKNVVAIISCALWQRGHILKTTAASLACSTEVWRHKAILTHGRLLMSTGVRVSVRLNENKRGRCVCRHKDAIFIFKLRHVFGSGQSLSDV
jgi:hypothetical protein